MASASELRKWHCDLLVSRGFPPSAYAAVSNIFEKSRPTTSKAISGYERPVLELISQGDAETLSSMISAGLVDPNAQDAYGNTVRGLRVRVRLRSEAPDASPLAGVCAVHSIHELN